MKNLIITMLIVLTVAFVVFSTGMSKMSDKCREKYGDSWTVYQNNTGGLFCKNTNGELKSL